MNRFTAALLAWFVSSPAALFACAACGAGENDPTRDAYTGSTAFLSFVPLIAIAGVCYTIYRYAKRDEVNRGDGQ
jgi:hypothetical protein